MTMTLTRPPEAPLPQMPRMVLTAATRDAAQRQLWRHAANRLCLAILADARYPVGSAQRHQSSGSTRPPLEPPRPQEGSDIFRVPVESVEIRLAHQGGTLMLTTDPLILAVQVTPGRLSLGPQLTLAVLRDWRAVETLEPLFRFRSERQQLRRRDGLSGDVVYLFEVLLLPHARELLDALNLD